MDGSEDLRELIFSFDLKTCPCTLGRICFANHGGHFLSTDMNVFNPLIFNYLKNNNYRQLAMLGDRYVTVPI